jgi:hypothetical protein
MQAELSLMAFYLEAFADPSYSVMGDGSITVNTW